MRKTCLGSGFFDTRDWYEVTAVADSSIQLRCIHPCVLVLIQPRSRRLISLSPVYFFWLVAKVASLKEWTVREIK